MLTKSKKRYWVAMFSRTGYELSQIIKKVEVIPDKIILNKSTDSLSTVCSEIKNLIDQHSTESLFTSKNPDIDTYRNMFLNDSDKPLIVTLHGWMKIIPPEICNEYEIYNGHPGLITKYPELKGKDPQNRAFSLKHDEIGTVIHKVTPEVDSGEILGIASIDNTYKTEEALSDTIREMSILLWSDFLREKLYD